MRAERRALLGTHVHAAHPRRRIVHVAILGRDVEIAEHHEVGDALAPRSSSQRVSASSHLQLVGEFLGARRLAVRHVQVDDAEIAAASGRREHAARRIVEVGDVAHDVGHRVTRQQRDAVVGFLAAEDAVVSRGRELRRAGSRGPGSWFPAARPRRESACAAIRAAARRARAASSRSRWRSKTCHRLAVAAAHWTRPCWRSSAFTSGGRPRNSTNASSALRLPPADRMASRKRCATPRSNTPCSSNAANASAASTSAHL